MHTGSVPGSRRSPRGGNGNPLQYSCLGNPMDRSLAVCSPSVRRVEHDEHPPAHNKQQMPFCMHSALLGVGALADLEGREGVLSFFIFMSNDSISCNLSLYFHSMDSVSILSCCYPQISLISDCPQLRNAGFGCMENIFLPLRVPTS